MIRIVGLLLSSVVSLIVSATPFAMAQTITYTSRNGQNLASCGRFGDGHWVQHTFSTADPTHDPLSVSDEGGPNWPASEAATTLDASPSLTGIALGGVGSASRGVLTGFGVDAVADTRDYWIFTLDQPACFTVSATLSAGATTATGVTQSFLFGAFGGGGQVIPDPGSDPNAFSDHIVGPGTLTRTMSGTLTAGQYHVQLNGRIDGGNTYPFSGSYVNSLSLSISTFPCHRGDMNCDGVFDVFDAEPLALALTDLTAYQQQFPSCEPMNGDMSGDGVLDGSDVGLFVDCMVTGDCP